MKIMVYNKADKKIDTRRMNMERKEYNAPSIDVMPTVADDVIATSEIILPPHVIGRPRNEGGDVDQF